VSACYPLFLLAAAHSGSPGRRAVKQKCWWVSGKVFEFLHIPQLVMSGHCSQTCGSGHGSDV